MENQLNALISVIVPAYNVENYLRNNGKIMDNIIPIIVPELEVQDIDNEVDWKLAEMKYQLMKNDF